MISSGNKINRKDSIILIENNRVFDVDSIYNINHVRAIYAFATYNSNERT